MIKSIPTQNLFHAVLAAGALLTALSSGAQAADLPQVHVKYRDLNISTPAGANTLYQRIRFAAQQVCDVSDQRDLARLANAKACTDHAIAEAVATVGNAMLTEVYQARIHNAALIKVASN